MHNLIFSNVSNIRGISSRIRDIRNAADAKPKINAISQKKKSRDAVK